CRSTKDGVQYLEHLATIADLFIQGYSLEFHELFSQESKKISLPTYPFAREHYWISEASGILPEGIAGASVSMIHPLLHENTSDLSRQCFTSTFTGKEFFLNDHQIKGEKVLPGVCYLEMARAAVEKASGVLVEGTTIHFKHIVWVKPIIVNGSGQRVQIGLSEEEYGQIQYEIYTSDDNEEDSIVHSQGTVEFKKKEEASLLDIEVLQSQMNQGTLSADSCYKAFKEMGIAYGEGYLGVQKIFQGENQILAKLSLPSSVQDTQSEYILHPSLIDSAIQSSIGLMLTNGALSDDSDASPGIGKWLLELGRWLHKPSLPFALDSLEILRACTFEMYAWVRYSDGSSASDKVQKLDIEICDKQGNVCVKMQGFSTRVLEGEVGLPKIGNTIGTLLATQVWKERAVLSSTIQQVYAVHLILLCEMQGVETKKLQPLIPGSHCENLESEEVHIEARFTEYALRCFKMIRKILDKRPQGKVFIQILVPNTLEQLLFTGLSGLLKTTALENPKIVGQIIQVTPEEKMEELGEKILENQTTPYEAIIRYDSGERLVLAWKELKETETKPDVAFKNNGVYLITGGVGGLGILFTREILRHAKDVKVILAGRSELFLQRQLVLRELQALGGVVDYQRVDVTNLEQVDTLIESIQGKYGKLDGIIHSAGVILDNFILKKSENEFKEVLLPKVTGTVNLDKATRGIELDFFVLFSSGAGVMGNIGQADYSTANAFMDQFAAYRNKLAESKQRQGQTLSINWPLWKEGGMGIDATREAMLEQSTGMVAMKTETGIQAFYQSLGFKNSQVLVMEGNLLKMRTVLLETTRIHEDQVEEEVTISIDDPKMMEEKTVQYLKKQFSSVLKLPSYKIDVDAPMEKYGIDSILAMNLTNQLEKTFGSLSKTLFFEYQTIREMARYFIEIHEPNSATLFRQDAITHAERSTTALSVNASALETTPKRRRRYSCLHTSGSQDTISGPLEIAIIGLSGRYPESVNVEEYWKNLRDGKDCIIEVPGDRWNWREYFSEDRSKRGYHYSKWGGFIEGVAEFDPLFFNISPREAEATDPQERLFLEHAWKAMEDAGYTRESLQIHRDTDQSGQVGVYVGVMYGEYQLLGAEESLRGNRIVFAGGLGSIANRVSYVLNLHGPSMTVDTMCSSSLTSIHLACQDLKQGRTNLAIAGGVNISIHPNKYLMLSAGQFISTKGQCGSFGEGGDGYIPGEGVGVVILKRLEEAVRDRDHIYGIIQGSAINHGGKTNGYTVPNPKAQRRAIERVLSESGIDPRHISYIEAHGTGTKLGDPIEIAALSQAFGKFTQEKEYCRIGSAKSNIGHCEGAAGVGGLTKVLLQMKYGQIVPSLHSSRLNSNIDFKNTPFVVNQDLTNWDCPFIDGQEIPKIAGISSFGAGGSNAHLIVKEHKDSQRKNEASISDYRFPVIVPFSARTKEQLSESVSNMLQFLREHDFAQDTKSPISEDSMQQEESNQNDPHGTSPLNLIYLSYTLQVGREAMEKRLGFIVSSVKELEEKLEVYLSGEQEIEECYQGEVKRNKEMLGVFT
ncbi:MAG: SDR family NAD(P)-dependent oxidoreductase, partial [Cytophagales bacterium]|nr:SDR family NAD(P)-dependent oxidoreductase [Cytophagales bacterium]